MSLLSGLFKKQDLPPLPVYPAIAVENIPPASALVFYGGTKITQWFGEHVYHFPYKPAPFHAAFYMEQGRVLNVGAFRTLHKLTDEFKSTRRVDVISYDLTPEIRKVLVEGAYFDVSQPHIGLQLPDYGVQNFLRAGLKFLWHKMGSGKNPICSQEVALEFLRGNVHVSEHLPEDTYPWDLVTYAMLRPTQAVINTVWTGPDFGK